MIRTFLQGNYFHRFINTSRKLHSFFKKKLGFTPCKAEQPTQSMELQEKQTKKIKAYRKSL